MAPWLILAAGIFLPDGRLEKPDREWTQDAWTLQIVYLQKGTRSEGIHGVLLHDDSPVAGQKGATLQTPLGRLAYYGDFGTRATRWAVSGWNFADESRIKHSSR